MYIILKGTEVLAKKSSHKKAIAWMEENNYKEGDVQVMTDKKYNKNQGIDAGSETRVKKMTKNEYKQKKDLAYSKVPKSNPVHTTSLCNTEEGVKEEIQKNEGILAGIVQHKKGGFYGIYWIEKESPEVKSDNESKETKEPELPEESDGLENDEETVEEL